MPSCTPVPEVTVKVPCQGTTHRLSWTGRKLRFHDHDAAGLRFLAALEVPCGCASIADRLPQGDLDIPEPLRAAYAMARGAVEARFRVTTQPLTATLVLRGFQPRIEATIQPVTGRVIGTLDQARCGSRSPCTAPDAGISTGNVSADQHNRSGWTNEKTGQDGTPATTARSVGHTSALAQH